MVGGTDADRGGMFGDIDPVGWENGDAKEGWFVLVAKGDDEGNGLDDKGAEFGGCIGAEFAPSPEAKLGKGLVFCGWPIPGKGFELDG